MRRLLIIPLLAVGLLMAGCASSSIQNPFSTPTLAKVETAYGAALAIAVNYRDACAKRLIPNSCRTIVPRLQQYGSKAHVAVRSARNFVKSYPNLNPVTALLAAQQAVTDFRSFQTANGVN